MNLTRFCSVLAVAAFVLVGASDFVSPAASQEQLQLSFEVRLRDNGFVNNYIWRNQSPFTTTSPGGTTINFFGLAEFNTFEAFQEDIVGTWHVSDPSGNMISFDIPHFPITEFPKVDLVSPQDGQLVYSGSTLQLLRAPDIFDESLPIGAMAIFFDETSVAVIDLGNFEYQIVLFTPGPSSAFVVAVGGLFRKGLITSATGDLEQFGIDEIIPIVTRAPQAEIVIARRPGDVNQDGETDLFDVGPFIDVIINGPYLIEADINSDGQVNIFDVEPFIQLLTQP